jgi:hypothetical protein
MFDVGRFQSVLSCSCFLKEKSEILRLRFLPQKPEGNSAQNDWLWILPTRHRTLQSFHAVHRALQYSSASRVLRRRIELPLRM